ncbi:MAG: hypothetical protein PVI99_01210 [Anaerolineales bacterium]|jgi:hypothetical protein
MDGHRVKFILSALIVLLYIAGCGGAENQGPIQPNASTDADENETEQTSEDDEQYNPEENIENFSHDNFDNPTEITNQWMPLKAGTQYIYQGVTEESGIVTEHEVIFTITDLIKVVDGIESVVIWDRDYSEGNLVETELAFFAQDNDGNVWRMGEYPEVYEKGVLVEAPAWISGLKNAVAGVMMPANPTVGAPSYSQGWGPAVDFTDRAQVDEDGLEVCVEIDCYDNVIMTAEYSRSEPNAFQLKYYAPGVGNIKVDWRGDDATRETLELVEIKELSAAEMEEVREMALQLEQSAYETSKEVYDQTEPAQ